MGIFSDRCEALVNPVTGMALTGVALEEAKKVASWPRCGHSVKKGAKFCSKCGASACGGWVKCPTCGEWVGNDSNFCWNCNTPLHPTDGVAIAGGVWARSAGVFAQRFEINNVKVPDGRDLQVQEGTVAVLMSGGAVEDVLDAGNFNVESLARKINWFGNPPPRSVVLVEAGETVLPLSVKDIPTKALEGSGLLAGVMVDFYGEAIVRFSGGKAAGVNFVTNVLKDRREITLADMSNRLIPSLERAVKDVCASITIHELVADPQIRIKLRKQMTEVAERELDASGIDLVRVSSADFDSVAYNKFVRGDAAKAEERMAEDSRRADIEHENALKELEEKVALGKFKSEKELLREKEAIELEYRMDVAQKQASWEKLQQKLDAERDETRRKRGIAERAYQEELEEARRAKAAAEKVRKQKEEDADRIRQWSLIEDEMTHKWSLEDKVQKREWGNAEARQKHEAEMSDMVRRASDAQTEHDWEMAIKRVAHENKVDQVLTDHALEKALKVCKGEIGVKELQDEYVRDKALRDVQIKEKIDDLVHSGSLKRKLEVAKVDLEIKEKTAVTDAKVAVITAQGKADVTKILTSAEVQAAAEKAKQQIEETEKWLKIAEQRDVVSQKSREWWIKERDRYLQQYNEAVDPALKAILLKAWERADMELHKMMDDE